MERRAENKDLRKTERDQGWDTVNRNFERGSKTMPNGTKNEEEERGDRTMHGISQRESVKRKEEGRQREENWMMK